MGFNFVIWRGEIYNIELGNPVGHEPAWQRPCVVVSNDSLNQSPGNLVAVVPITSTRYGLRSHVAIEASSSGLDRDSYARCDQVRTVSANRFGTLQGFAPVDAMAQIATALRYILDL